MKNRSSVGWLYTVERVTMEILSEDGHGAELSVRRG